MIIGTRGSALALAQTTWVKDQILRRNPDLQITVQVIKTTADKNQSASLRSSSSVGVFVKELEQALLAREIDIAVHSMKDLPTTLLPGLAIGAVPEREDARDALILPSPDSRGIAALPEGARIGTGSVRRQSQLLALRPDLQILDIRGNVDSRLRKLQDGAYDAIILACAGLNRLGLQNRISAPLEFDQMLPAPGQAALAIEIREDDERAKETVSLINHPHTAATVEVERRFLLLMGGGCNVPVAAYARIDGDWMEIDALVASPDGRQVTRHSMRAKWDAALQAIEPFAALFHA